MNDDDRRVREIVQQLRQPVPDINTLLCLLTAPLDSIDLLPPAFLSYNTQPLPRGSFNVRRHLALIQRAILENIYPVWQDALSECHALPLVEQYICPDLFHYAGPVAFEAYGTILSSPMTALSVTLLDKLSKRYTLERMFVLISDSSSQLSRETDWEDYVQNTLSVPAKVANFIGRNDMPEGLRQDQYFKELFRRFEALVWTLSSLSTSKQKSSLARITYLLVKWVNHGLFPFTKPNLPSATSFWDVVLPCMQQRVTENNGYYTLWNDIVFAIPSIIAVQAVVTSLFGHLEKPDVELDASENARAAIKQQADILTKVLDEPARWNEERLATVVSIILGRDFDCVHARIFVCWFAAGDSVAALRILVDNTLAKWTSEAHIRYSTLPQHRYVTVMLVLAASHLGSGEVAADGRFISGVGSYISHMDPSIRLCGMLAAEVIASLAGKELAFGLWDGDEPTKVWARAVRRLLIARDKDANVSILTKDEGEGLSRDTPIVVNSDALGPHDDPPTTASISVIQEDYDSDDSFTGYASPTSSRSPSPTPSELDEREKDPTLNVSKKQVARPVYLLQLGDLLREATSLNGKDSAYEADKMEMALREGAALIRRKQNFGTELDENAVNLTHGFLNLQNRYELDNFEERVEASLVALVVGCPTKAAPCIAEQFFVNQYSVQQRCTMLNALVLGARELSGIVAHSQPTSFPSKLLQGALHQKYLPATETIPHLLTEAIQNLSIEGESPQPGPRTRLLRTSRAPKVQPVTPNTQRIPAQLKTFTSVASEYFLGPLISLFWTFLRDEQTREGRTAHLVGRQQYYSAGTGLVLNPLVLSQFLRAFAMLVHLSRNALEWRAVIAPNALELALMIGMKPISRSEDEEDQSEPGEHADRRQSGMQKQARVLTAVMELMIIVLDASIELDDGRTLALDFGPLVLGVQEWAGALFSRLDSGERASGMGGRGDANLPKVCASVVLKVDTVASKWRRSMVSFE